MKDETIDNILPQHLHKTKERK